MLYTVHADGCYAAADDGPDPDLLVDRVYHVTQSHISGCPQNVQMLIAADILSIVDTKGKTYESYEYGNIMHFARGFTTSGGRGFIMDLVGGKKVEFGTNAGFAISLAIEDTMRIKQIGHYNTAAMKKDAKVNKKGGLSAKNLRTMFDAVDVDKNGSIDVGESSLLLKDLDIELNPTELRQAFRVVDEDDSGRSTLMNSRCRPVLKVQSSCRGDRKG